MMFGNNSSWFPVRNFTKSRCHFDWMMGATKFCGVRDFLTNEVIPRMATVFWNRTLNANVALSTYESVRNGKNPEMVEKCRKIGLPLDIRV